MQSDVIVVLAGGITDSGELPVSVRKRVEKAVELYRSRQAPRILMSGRWSTYRNRHTPPKTEAQAMVEYAQSLGVPATVLLKEEHSQNTLSNVFFTTKLFLHPNQWKRVTIVTSDFHITRTRSIFSQLLDSSFELQFISSLSHFSMRKRSVVWMSERIFLLTLPVRLWHPKAQPR